MKDVTLGVFKTQIDAENAIRKLESEGFSTNDLSVIARSESDSSDVVAETGAHMAGGAVSGAATGGAVGALAGLLIGVGAITVPGIGALLIGGPLVATLGLTGAAATTASGALTGAAAGSLVGAFVGLGLPRESAEAYEGYVKEGGVVIALSDLNTDHSKARDILKAQGALRIDSVTL
jgi:hypothetical protein